MAKEIATIAQWFGNMRALGKRVGERLGALKWCAVPFAGGCPELAHIRTKAGVASDLHCHLINLARTIVHQREAMVARCDEMLFHPAELMECQARCLTRVGKHITELGLFSQMSAAHRQVIANTRPNIPYKGDVDWAADYFACTWMGRGGASGAKREFYQKLSTRWGSDGGDSAKRWRSAVTALEVWQSRLKVWSFECQNAFAILDATKNVPRHGIYADPPWPDDGDKYEHGFTPEDHERLAGKLVEFTECKVILRTNVHPMIRDLYPEDRWDWEIMDSRNQSNKKVREALVVLRK